MPIPKPKKNEPKKQFISRCMANQVMQTESPDTKQRYAICLKQITQSIQTHRSYNSHARN